jgi:hypothetical protein
MFRKHNSNFVTALITGVALIALAFYKHYRPITVSPESLFYAAAVICLLPVLYAPVRCKGFRKRRANVS